MKNETVLLTFLGTGNYQSAVYQFRDHPQTDPEVLFSAALATYLKPDRVISLQTQGASEKHGQALDQRMQDLGVRHQMARVPEGKSEAELWEIFQVITKEVPKDCELHLDVTHGFRSLPILSFIALNYLRTTRKIALGGVHYGAYEARNAEGIVPAFDLTPFLTLLDWTAAADQFLATGSATRLAKLLEGIQQSKWRNNRDARKAYLPTGLKSIARDLQTAANNLNLLRIGSIAKGSTNLSRQLDKHENEILEFATPFLEVLKPVRNELTRFNSTDLPVLLDLIGWLIEKNRHDAALTLASEWLVSWVMVQLGAMNHYTDESIRRDYDRCLTLWMWQQQPDDHLTPKPEEVHEPDEKAAELLAKLKSGLDAETMSNLASIGSKLKDARNDLNHAGFRKHPKDCNSLIASTEKIYDDLCKLFSSQLPNR